MKIFESKNELKYYTDMNIIMHPFKKYFYKFTWLISDYECNYYPDKRICVSQEYVWMKGEELYSIIESNEIQFIWGVFSGFSPGIKFKEIEKYKMPESEYFHHRENKNNTQNPLASVEIVSWDSGMLYFKIKDDKYIKILKEILPKCKEI